MQRRMPVRLVLMSCREIALPRTMRRASRRSGFDSYARAAVPGPVESPRDTDRHPMIPRLSTPVTAVVLAVATFLMCAHRLQGAPMYLSPDEVIIAVDAHSIASTARDVEGHFLPLYFNIQMRGEDRRGWFTPAIFYLSALCQKVLPFSESTVRMPSVLVGTIDVVLMFLVARRLFHSEWLAVAATALLAMTPAHFMLTRLGLDYLYPLPFILAWLLCLTHFSESGRSTTLFASTLFLGLGFFSYIASVVMMPLYLLLTGVLLFLGNRPPRFYAAALAGFCLPLLLLLVPWLARHPTAMTDTMQRYDLYDAQKLNALQGIRAFLSYPNLDRITSIYWTYFSPSFLFLSGGSQTMFSTRTTGIFLLPVALFLLFGIYEIVTKRRNSIGLVILLGFVTGPAAAAILGGEGGASQRAVEMIPFGVILSIFGVQCLWSAQDASRLRIMLLLSGATISLLGVLRSLYTVRGETRIIGFMIALMLGGLALAAAGYMSRRIGLHQLIAVCLLAFVPLQFGAFYAGYFTEYRFRSAPWFGGNLAGALEKMIQLDAEEHPPAIYFAALRSTSGLLDIRNRWMDNYWRFSLIKHGRQDLLDRTAAFDAPDQVPAGSLVLGNVGDLTADGLVKSGRFKIAALIQEPDNSTFFQILRR